MAEQIVTLSDTQIEQTKEKFEKLTKEINHFNEQLNTLVQKSFDNNKFQELSVVIEKVAQMKNNQQEFMDLLMSDLSDKSLQPLYDGLINQRNIALTIISRIGKINEKSSKSLDDFTKNVADTLTKISDDFAKNVEDTTDVIQNLSSNFKTKEDKILIDRKVFLNTMLQMYSDLKQVDIAKLDALTNLNEEAANKVINRYSGQSKAKLTNLIKRVTEEVNQTVRDNTVTDGSLSLLAQIKEIRELNINNSGDVRDVTRMSNILTRLADVNKDNLEQRKNGLLSSVSSGNFSDFAKIDKFVTLSTEKATKNMQEIVSMSESISNSNPDNPTVAKINNDKIVPQIQTLIEDVYKANSEVLTSAITEFGNQFDEEAHGNDETHYNNVQALNLSNAFTMSRTSNYNNFRFNNAFNGMFSSDTELNQLYNNYNRSTYVYNNEIKSILSVEENTSKKYGIDKNDLLLNDIKSGRLSYGLGSNNQNLIQLSHEFNQRKLSGANKHDKETAKDMSKMLAEAIHQTYQQIYVTSRFDPDSKLLKTLKEQAKQLEEEKNDLDESIKNKELQKHHSLFKDIKSVAGFFGKALALMGLGGLFSIHSWMDKIKNRANANGEMLYNNYLANASIGAPISQNANELVFGLGQNLYTASYGQIDFGVPSAFYRSLAGSILGGQGGQKASDLMNFTRAFVVPSQLYGIDAGTFSQGINAFYYENRMSAKETIGMMYRVMADAKKAQIPINQYMNLISQMVTQYRILGYNGKQTVDNMSYMIAEGYRAEDAKSFIGQMYDAQQNFSANLYNSVYSVIGGGADNMWQGMYANLKTVDRFGNPYKDRQKYVGSQMLAKLHMVTDMFDNPIMKQFGTYQVTKGMGLNMKNSDAILYAVEDGDESKLETLFEGAQQDELSKNQAATEATKGFTQELQQASSLLSETQKNKAEMMASANKLSDNFVGHGQAMQQFEQIAEEGINKVEQVMEQLIALVGQLPDLIKKSPLLSQAFMFASQHPFLTLAGGLVGFSLLKNGAKHAFNFAKEKAFGHWNDVKHKDVTDEVKETTPSETKTLKEEPPKLNNNKGFFNNMKSRLADWKPKSFNSKSLSSLAKKIPHKGLMGVVGTGMTLGAMLLGSSSSASANPSEQGDENQSEEQDDEQSINSMYIMFKTGDSKVTVYNKDGKLIDVTGRTGIESWLMQNGFSLFSALTVATATGASGKFAYDKLKQFKEAKFPKFPSVKMPKEISEKDIQNTEKLANPSTKPSMLDATLTFLGLKPGSEKGKPKGKEKLSEKEKVPKESNWSKWGGRLFNFLTVTGSVGSELLSDDDRTTGQKVVAGGIEAGTELATYKVLDKTVGRIPYIGKPLALLLPFADSLSGTNIMSKISEKAKAFAGVQAKYKSGNEMFLDAMNNQTGMTGASFEKLIHSETAQGNYFRSYLSANGIEYDKLNEQEKLFFKLQMDELAFVQQSVAKVLALAIIALKNAQVSGNFNLNGDDDSIFKKDGKKLKDDIIQKIKQDAQDSFPEGGHDFENINQAAHFVKYGQRLYEKLNDEGYDSEKLNQLASAITYAKYSVWAMNGFQDYDLDYYGTTWTITNPYEDDSSDRTESEDIADTTYSGGITPVLKEIWDRCHGKSSEEISSEQAQKIKEDLQEQYGETIAEQISSGYNNLIFAGWVGPVKKQYMTEYAQEKMENPDNMEDDTQQNSNQAPDFSNANAGAYASMAEQAKMISQLTGLPADVIFAQLAFETGQNPSDMAYSDKIHNYGGTTVDMGHGKNDSGFGIYVNNKEGAEAYVKGTVPVREQLPQLREAIAQGDLKKYVHLLKYGMEESGKGNYQYFTGDENEYLNGIMSYLSLAHKLGLNGVTANGTFDFSNYQPRTLKEQSDKAWEDYRKAVGNGKKISGYLVNGVYIDTSRQYQSIEEQGKKLREAMRDGSYYTDPQKVYKELDELNKKNAKKIVEDTNTQIKKQQESQKQIQEMAKKEADAKKQQQEQENKDKTVCSLSVMGTLKQGIKLEQVLDVIKAIAQADGFNTDTKMVQQG